MTTRTFTVLVLVGLGLVGSASSFAYGLAMRQRADRLQVALGRAYDGNLSAWEHDEATTTWRRGEVTVNGQTTVWQTPFWVYWSELGYTRWGAVVAALAVLGLLARKDRPMTLAVPLAALLADAPVPSPEAAATLFPPYFGVMLLGLVAVTGLALLLFALGFRVIDWITPGNLAKELLGDSGNGGRPPNMALAVVVSAMVLGLALVISCTVIAVLVH